MKSEFRLWFNGFMALTQKDLESIREIVRGEVSDQSSGQTKMLRAEIQEAKKEVIEEIASVLNRTVLTQLEDHDERLV